MKSTTSLCGSAEMGVARLLPLVLAANLAVATAAFADDQTNSPAKPEVTTPPIQVQSTDPATNPAPEPPKAETDQVTPPVQAPPAETPPAPPTPPTPAAPAVPATSAPPPKRAVKMQPVIVTGSHIPTAIDQPVSPVLTLTKQQIDESGATTISDVIRKLPQNSSGSFAENNAASFAPGASGVSLRGLGQQSTLVLINGRRVAPYAFGQNVNGVNAGFVDLNSIPLEAVDRIEVLKDSGSAIYGSDAIAGVVNIILKKDYQGLELTAQYGDTTHRDSGEQTYSMVTGMVNDKANAMFFMDYYDRNAQYLRDRENSANADHTPQGGIDFRSSASPQGLVFDPFSGNELFVPPTGAPTTNALSATDFPGNHYNFNKDIVDYPQTTRYGGYTVINYNITDRLTAFVEAGYRKILTELQSAATPVFGDTDGYTIGPNNPFNPYAGITNAPIAFRWRANQAGPRIDDIDTDVIRAVPGLKLEIGEDWYAETAFLFSSSKSIDNGKNYLSSTALQAALNDPNPATALNVLGGPDYVNNPATIDALKVRTTREAETQLMQYDIKANGRLWDLPAGPIGVAFGGETRTESISDIPDTLSSQFQIVSEGGVQPSHGSRDSDALYGELGIPLFTRQNAQTALEQLEVQLAGRFEYYSDFGTTAKPKIGIKWQPAKPITFKASYSQGFRAPSLDELFVENIGFQDGIIDTARFNGTHSAADEGGTQYKIISGGNANLKPENSDSYYGGLIFEPPAIKGLSLTLDYIHIDVKNVIQAEDLQKILDLPLAQQSAFVTRNPPSAQDIALGVPGTIVSIDQRFINLTSRQVDSVDFGVDYEVDTDVGGFTYDFNGTYLASWREKISPDSPTTQNAGVFDFPKIKFNTSVFWAPTKKFSFGPTMNYTGSYGDSFIGKRITEFVTFDLQATYQAPYESTITVGVNNILDDNPPLSSQNSEGYDTAIADNRGRFIYGRITKKL